MAPIVLFIYIVLLVLIFSISYKLFFYPWVPLLPKQLQKIKFLYYGHRGSPLVSPENTLLSFQEAIDNSMDGIELDVQLTKDQKLVIYHDEYINYNNSIVKISNLTLAEINQIDVRKNFNELSFQKIPELEEVLNILPHNIILNIEVKSYGWDMFNNKIERQLLSVIDDKINYNQLIISSFNPLVIKRIKELNSSISIALIWSKKSYKWFTFGIVSNYKLFAYYSKPDVFHVNIKDVNQSMINWFSKRNIQLYAYTVNTKSDLEKAKKYNLNGIFTDDPKIKNV